MATSSEKRIVILGGGPCGLGSAIRLHELGYTNWCLYEAESTVGGLSKSYTDDQGFTWDVGGHVIFSHYQYFDDVLSKLGPEDRVELVRKCLVFMKDDASYEVNYPLQNHVDELPPELWQRCLEGLLQSYVQAQTGDVSKEKPANFAEWGKRIMGDGLVEAFLRPYNEKLWAWPMESMSADWLGERVAVPDFKKILSQFTKRVADSALLPDSNLKPQVKEGWGPNASFKYCREGGTGAIWLSVANKFPSDKIRCNSSVLQIDPEKKMIGFANGTTDTYDCLINTVCLQTLCQRILSDQYVQKQLLKELSGGLKYSSVVIVGLGIQSQHEPERLDNFHWGYFPQTRVPFYRCTVLSHYSQLLCPPVPRDSNAKYYSLLFECSCSDYRPLEETELQLVARVEACAKEFGFIHPAEGIVISRFAKIFPYAYPTPSTDRDGILSKIQTILEHQDILSRGRFGGWKYEVGNMDHSLMQGVEAVNRILLGGTEPTYTSPNIVNNPANRQTERLDLTHFVNKIVSSQI